MNKKTLLLSSLVPLLLVGAYFLFFHTPTPRVLVFSKTEGYRHASIEPGIEAIRRLGAEHGFEVEATEDAALFNQRDLARFNVVVFLSTTGDILDDAQQIAFARFIQAGGGFVGIHAASDTEYGWPWYGRLVGGYFTSHPGNPNVREGTLHVADASHPSTEMLPDPWVRTDEWYDFRDRNPDVHVLLNIDETTYKRADEHPAPAPRPIAWYHEFDGGRAWYTALGHTSESFAEPLFLKHLLGGIEWAIGDGKPVDFGAATVMPEENRFTKTVMDQNLNEPMELDFLDPDRIIFVERKGAIKIHDLQAGRTETIATLDVFTGEEEGLLGVAVDPNYAENHWIYLSYSHPVDSLINLSRFVLEGNVLDRASEKVLLSVPVQRHQCCHVGGSVEFDGQGNLFFSIGDNTNPFASDGYAPIDERQGPRLCRDNDDTRNCNRSPWDAQKSSANTQDLRGKILRITPQPDGTYTIPEGNLFSDPAEGRPEIYVMGNRNPFRLAVDRHTGYLYWGEVGPDARDDNPLRGPKGHDEVNQARAAGFFGWPYFVGDNKPYRDYDFATGQSGPPFDPMRPVNDSPNNTGARVLPPAQPAFIWYPYGASPEFPLVGSGGRNAMAGPVYYYDDYPASDVKFPRYYDGKLFIYDWVRDWIAVVTMDEEGDYAWMEPFLPTTLDVSNTMDMLFGPDGAMYILEYGKGWFTQNLDARLSKITYNAGNRPPQAQIAADHTVGATPLTVAFSGAASYDNDYDDLRFAWDVDNDGTVDAREPAFTHTYREPGVYTAVLTVSDPSGAESRASVEILAGNAMPTLSLAVRPNRTFYFDDRPLVYEVSVTDPEDGALADGSIPPEQVVVSLQFVPEGRDLTIPAQGHQELMTAATTALGKDLIAQADCQACHQENSVSLGPSYVQVAERYAGQEGAEDYLVQKIIQGGSGVWGDRAMAAHPELPPEQAAQMVRYILSLAEQEGEAPGTALPPSGTVTLTEHRGNGTDGRYILTASYTDRGGEGVGPLTAREMLILRHPQVEAEDFDVTEGASRFTLTAEMTGGPEMEVVVGMAGSYIAFEQIDLSGIAALTAVVGVSQGNTTGGTIQVRLDAPDGPVVGTIEVPAPDGPAPRFGPETAPLTPTDGLHDVYLTFDGPAGGAPVCIVDALVFSPPPAP